MYTISHSTAYLAVSNYVINCMFRILLKELAPNIILPSKFLPRRNESIEATYKKPGCRELNYLISPLSIFILLCPVQI
jgi:hypothetical protein